MAYVVHTPVMLCDRERAIYNLVRSDGSFAHLGTPTMTAEEAMIIDAAITASSTLFRVQTRRDIAQMRYDELFSVYDPTEFLFLKNPPIQHVERIMITPTTVLEVTNTSTSIQQAWAEVSETAIVLHRVASGVPTTTESTFATNVTVTALDTAIDAVANGWSASVPDATYSLWPSQDLVPVGRKWAMNQTVQFKLHAEGLTEYDLDARTGLVTYGDYWPRGTHQIRVIWSGGFTEIPHEIQEAIAESAAATFGRASRDPGIIQESRPGFHYIQDRSVATTASFTRAVAAYRLPTVFN